MEDLGKPAVMLLNKDFEADAKSAASVRKLPGLRLVLTNIPCEIPDAEDIRVGVEALFDHLVLAMTRPLTAEEKSPKLKEVEKPSRVVFKGNLEEVNRFFYKRGWANATPIIPPTEEAVKEMLTGTDLPADHVVAKIPTRAGKATVEKIAVNAVMAGALPIHMPVLIAGVQAMTEGPIKVDCYNASVASFAPFWIINGPIRNDLRVNSGQSLLGSENIANAAIARTMVLLIRNIGGVRPGLEDMSSFGHEGKYSMAIGENEEDSPWNPLHVEYHGFNKGDSAVTLFYTTCRTFMGLFPFGFDADAILRGIIYNMPNTWGATCLILNPGTAKRLAEAGWTKKEVVSFIMEYARMPAYAHWEGAVPGGNFSSYAPREKVPLGPEFSMAKLRPGWLRVVVAGGTVNNYNAMVFSGGFNHYGNWASKKVELPANWEKLLKKYKDIVPTYASYG